MIALGDAAKYSNDAEVVFGKGPITRVRSSYRNSVLVDFEILE